MENKFITVNYISSQTLYNHFSEAFPYDCYITYKLEFNRFISYSMLLNGLNPDVLLNVFDGYFKYKLKCKYISHLN